MSHLDPEPTDAELDAVLRRSVPKPDPDWVTGLERRLVPAGPRSESVWRLPQLRLGAALAAGFAALLIVLALAGVGPLGGDSSDVRAKDDCKMVTVTRVEKVPVMVESSGGASHIEYRRERVQRVERQCR